MTIVINLFGGPSIGKSTISAGLFYELKKLGKNVELSTEYVKRWAWTGRTVGPYDQLYIFAKQARSEYELYDKVDYIITDSPLLLSPIYEKFRKQGFSLTEEAVKKHMDLAKKNGVTHKNFVLSRNKPYNTAGRYEDEKTAIKIDKFIKKYLDVNFYDFDKIEQSTEAAIIKEILSKIGIEETSPVDKTHP